MGANRGKHMGIPIYILFPKCHIRANHNRAKTRVIFAFILIGTRQNALYFNGFEAAAPCKGRGISAQGRVNGVNDTLGPPHDWVLLHSRPVGAICRKWGNAPRHTRAYYRAKHTGVLSGETHGRIIGRNTRANYRAKHTVLPIYYISFSKRMPTPDLRPWDVGGGALPLFRRSAPTGRDTF